MFIFVTCWWGALVPNYSFLQVWNLSQLNIFRKNPLKYFSVHVVRQHVSKRTQTQGENCNLLWQFLQLRFAQTWGKQGVRGRGQSLEECQPAVTPEDIWQWTKVSGQRSRVAKTQMQHSRVFGPGPAVGRGGALTRSEGVGATAPYPEGLP